MSVSDSGALPVHAEHDWAEIAPSIAIVDAVAAIEDVDPREVSTVLGTTLYEQINPDALDTLATEGELAITFSIGEYTVRVDGNRVTIDRE
ncbi:HalOD1 output domain-containing protein [Natrononativus amylolyticus]|uniref:HalOD1 output domain-containing protein n=1 Tax=Natrononativus amylolyticus TaxID=2963434 RepID=UPI0020CC65DC|nr:HalOD1 output domain-containing protein [Natrononativus amylolyticus]